MTKQFRSGLRMAREVAIYRLAVFMRGLSDDDWSALNQLNVVHRFVGRGRFLSVEGETVSRLRVLCKGWAIRSTRLDGERRQILDFVLPGDLVGLHRDGDNVSTCHVTALTACEVGEIALSEFDSIARHYPVVANGLNNLLTRELALANDQVLRLGRMTAYERVCSFLLDIYSRQRLMSPGIRTVDFPITQTLLADALGLSVVHVNRQVMQLRREGLVKLDRRQLTVQDEGRLAEICGYRDRRFNAGQHLLLQAAS